MKSWKFQPVLAFSLQCLMLALVQPPFLLPLLMLATQSSTAEPKSLYLRGTETEELKLWEMRRISPVKNLFQACRSRHPTSALEVSTG